MSKTNDTKKNSKKEPSLTKKEKKALKRDKKIEKKRSLKDEQKFT